MSVIDRTSKICRAIKLDDFFLFFFFYFSIERNSNTITRYYPLRLFHQNKYTCIEGGLLRLTLLINPVRFRFIFTKNKFMQTQIHTHPFPMVAIRHIHQIKSHGQHFILINNLYIDIG